MARLLTSGFEINDNLNGYEMGSGTSGATSQTTVVRSGLRAVSIANASAGRVGNYGTFAAAVGSGPYYARIYVRVGTLPAATTRIAALSTGGNGISLLATSEPNVRLTSTGTLLLYNGTTQIGSASPALTLGAWYRLEIEYSSVPASGSRVLRARLDGTEFAGSATQTTLNTVNAFAYGINLAGDGVSAGQLYFDDLAVNDSTGSVQNTYPGDGRVITLFPTGAGDSNAWLNTAAAAGSTTNWQLVDDNPPNDTTDLVQSVTVNAQDLYTFPQSGISPGDTVNSVQVIDRHRNATSDATTSFALVIEKTAGGTKTQGTTLIPNTTLWSIGAAGTGSKAASLTTYADPDGAPWTQSTLDTMQAGPKLVAAGTNRIQVTSMWVTIDYTPVGPYFREGVVGNAAGALTLTIPASTMAGDHIIIPTIYKTALGSATVATPAGFTDKTAGGIDLTGASAAGWLFTKVAAGTPGQPSSDAGQTVTLTPSAGTQQLDATLAVIANADPTWRDWGLVDQGTTAAAGVVVPAETASAGDLIVNIGLVRGSTNGTVTFTGPTGTPVRLQTTAISGAAQNVAAFHAESWAAGTQTITASRPVWSIAGQIVLKPLSSNTSDSRGVADAVTVSGAAAAALTAARAVAESLTVLDAAGRLLSFQRASADTASVADTAGFTYGLNRNLPQGLVVTDSGARSVTVTRVVAGDTVTSTDTAGRKSEYTRGVGDALVATGVAARLMVVPRGAADTVAFGDAATRTAQVAVRVLADTVQVAAEATGTGLASRGAADAVASADTASSTKTATRSVSDTLTVAGSAGRVLQQPRNVVGAAATDETAGGAGTYPRGVTDAVTASGTAVAGGGVRARAAADTVTAAGAAGRTSTQSTTAGALVGFADAASRAASSATRAVPETVTAGADADSQAGAAAAGVDSVTAGDTAHQAATVARSLTGTVTLAQAVTRQTTQGRAAAETATAGDTLARQLTAVANPTEQVTAADTVTRGRTSSRPLAETLTAVDAGAGRITRTAVPSNGVTVAEVASWYASASTVGSGAVTAADSTSRATNRNRAAADAVSTASTGAQNTDRARTVADTARPVDQAQSGTLYSTASTAAVNLTDAVARQATNLARTVPNILGLAGVPSRLLHFARAAANTVGPPGLLGARFAAGRLGLPGDGWDSVEATVWVAAGSGGSVDLDDAALRALTGQAKLFNAVFLVNSVAGSGDMFVVIVRAYPSTVTTSRIDPGAVTAEPVPAQVLASVVPNTVRRTI